MEQDYRQFVRPPAAVYFCSADRIVSGFYERPDHVTTNTPPSAEWPSVFGDARCNPLLDRLTHQCDIIETGNDSWRFKSRADDHMTTRARHRLRNPDQFRRCER